MNLRFKREADAYHHVGHVDITQHLQLAGKQQNQADLEYLHASFFREALNHQLQIDKTQHFHEFHANIRPYTLSLPLLLHFKHRILVILLSHLTRPKSQCVPTLLALIPTLAQDLRDELIPHFGEIIQTIISVLDHGDNTRSQLCFQSMQKLIKVLESYLTPYILDLYITSFAPLLAHNKELVRDFAAETLGFLIKRIRNKQDLQAILNHLLLPPQVFISIIKSVSIETVSLPKEDDHQTIAQLTDADHQQIFQFHQSKEIQKSKVKDSTLSKKDNKLALNTFITSNQTTLLSQTDQSRLHDIRNVHQTARVEKLKIIQFSKDKDANKSILHTLTSTSVAQDDDKTSIASRMRTTASIFSIQWTETNLHRLMDGLSLLLVNSLKSLMGQLTHEHDKICQALWFVSSSACINQTTTTIRNYLQQHKSADNSINNSLSNLHIFRVEVIQSIYSRLASYTTYEHHEPLLTTLYQPLVQIITRLGVSIKAPSPTISRSKPKPSNNNQAIPSKPIFQAPTTSKALLKKQSLKHIMADSSSGSESDSSSSDSDSDIDMIPGQHTIKMGHKAMIKTTKAPILKPVSKSSSAPAQTQSSNSQGVVIPDEDSSFFSKQQLSSTQVDLVFTYATLLAQTTAFDSCYDILTIISCIQMLLCEHGSKIEQYNSLSDIMLQVFSLLINHPEFVKAYYNPADSGTNSIAPHLFDITFCQMATMFVQLFRITIQIASSADTARYPPSQEVCATTCIETLFKYLPTLIAPYQQQDKKVIIPPSPFYFVFTVGLRQTLRSDQFNDSFLPHFVDYSLLQMSQQQHLTDSHHSNNTIALLDLALSPQPRYLASQPTISQSIFTPLNISSMLFQDIGGNLDPLAGLCSYWAKIWSDPSAAITAEYKRIFYQQYIIHRVGEHYSLNKESIAQAQNVQKTNQTVQHSTVFTPYIYPVLPPQSATLLQHIVDTLSLSTVSNVVQLNDALRQVEEGSVTLEQFNLIYQQSLMNLFHILHVHIGLFPSITPLSTKISSTVSPTTTKSKKLKSTLEKPSTTPFVNVLYTLITHITAQFMAVIFNPQMIINKANFNSKSIFFDESIQILLQVLSLSEVAIFSSSLIDTPQSNLICLVPISAHLNFPSHTAAFVMQDIVPIYPLSYSSQHQPILSSLHLSSSQSLSDLSKSTSLQQALCKQVLSILFATSYCQLRFDLNGKPLANTSQAVLGRTVPVNMLIDIQTSLSARFAFVATLCTSMTPLSILCDETKSVLFNRKLWDRDLPSGLDGIPFNSLLNFVLFTTAKTKSTIGSDLVQQLLKLLNKPRLVFEYADEAADSESDSDEAEEELFRRLKSRRLRNQHDKEEELKANGNAVDSKRIEEMQQLFANERTKAKHRSTHKQQSDFAENAHTIMVPAGLTEREDALFVQNQEQQFWAKHNSTIASTTKNLLSFLSAQYSTFLTTLTTATLSHGTKLFALQFAKALHPQENVSRTEVSPVQSFFFNLFQYTCRSSSSHARFHAMTILTTLPQLGFKIAQVNTTHAGDLNAQREVTFDDTDDDSDVEIPTTKTSSKKKTASLHQKQQLDFVLTAEQGACNLFFVLYQFLTVPIQISSVGLMNVYLETMLAQIRSQRIPDEYVSVLIQTFIASLSMRFTGHVKVLQTAIEEMLFYYGDLVWPFVYQTLCDGLIHSHITMKTIVQPFIYGCIYPYPSIYTDSIIQAVGKYSSGSNTDSHEDKQENKQQAMVFPQLSTSKSLSSISNVVPSVVILTSYIPHVNNVTPHSNMTSNLLKTLLLQQSQTAVSKNIQQILNLFISFYYTQWDVIYPTIPSSAVEITPIHLEEESEEEIKARRSILPSSSAQSYKTILFNRTTHGRSNKNSYRPSSKNRIRLFTISTPLNSENSMALLRSDYITSLLQSMEDYLTLFSESLESKAYNKLDISSTILTPLCVRIIGTSFEELRGLAFKLILKANLGYIKPYLSLIERFLDKTKVRDALSSLSASIAHTLQVEEENNQSTMTDENLPAGVIILPRHHRVLLLPILFRLMTSHVRSEAKTNITALRAAISNILGMLPIYETIPYLSQLFTPLIFPLFNAASPQLAQAATTILSLQHEQFSSMLVPFSTTFNNSTSLLSDLITHSTIKFVAIFQKYEAFLSMLPHVIAKSSANDGLKELLSAFNNAGESPLANTLLWSIDPSSQAHITTIIPTVNVSMKSDNTVAILKQFTIGTAAPTQILQDLFPQSISKFHVNYSSIIGPIDLYKLLAGASFSQSSPPFARTDDNFIQTAQKSGIAVSKFPQPSTERLTYITQMVITFVVKVRHDARPLLSTLLAFTFHLLSSSISRMSELQQSKADKHNMADDTDTDSDDDEEDDEIGQDSDEPVRKDITIGRAVTLIRQYRQLRASLMDLTATIIDLFYEDFGMDVEISSSKDKISSTTINLFGQHSLQILPQLQTLSSPINSTSNSLKINLKPRSHFSSLKAILLLLLPSLHGMYTEQLKKRTSLLKIIVTLCKHRATQAIFALPEFVGVLPSFIGIISSPHSTQSVAGAVLESIESLIVTNNQLSSEAQGKVPIQPAMVDSEADDSASDGDLSDDEKYIQKASRFKGQKQNKKSFVRSDLTLTYFPSEDSSQSPGLAIVLNEMLTQLAPIICTHMNDRLQNVLSIGVSEEDSAVVLDAQAAPIAKRDLPTFEPTSFLNIGGQKTLPTKDLAIVFHLSKLITDSKTSSILLQILLPYLPRGNPTPPHSLDIKGGISDFAQQAAEENALPSQTHAQAATLARKLSTLSAILDITTNIIKSISDAAFLVRIQDVLISKLLTIFDLPLRVQLISILAALQTKLIAFSTPMVVATKTSKKDKKTQLKPVEAISQFTTLQSQTIALIQGFTAVSIKDTQYEPDFNARSKAYQALGASSIEEFNFIMSKPLQHRDRDGQNFSYFKSLPVFDIQAIVWSLLHDCYSQYSTVRESASDVISHLLRHMAYNQEDIQFPSTNSRIIETFHRHARFALTRRELVLTRRIFLEIIGQCGRQFSSIFPAYHALINLKSGNFFDMVTDIQTSRRGNALKELRHILEQEQKAKGAHLKPEDYLSVSRPLYSSDFSSPVVHFILPLLFNFVEESQSLHSAQQKEEEQQAGKRPFTIGNGNGNAYGIDGSLTDEIIRCISSCCSVTSWNQYKTHVARYLKLLSAPKAKKMHKTHLRLVCAMIDAFPFPLGKAASEMSIEQNIEMFHAGKNPNSIKPKRRAVTADSLISDRSKTAPADQIRSDISSSLVPQLFDFCTELQVNKGQSSRHQAPIRTVRTSVIITVVKLTQKLTPHDFSHHFPKLIKIITEQLGRKDPYERQSARAVFAEVFKTVGSEFFFYLIMELKSALTINHQLHVLGHEVANLLQLCTTMRPANSKSPESRQAIQRMANNVDYCIPVILQIMHDDYFGLIAEEKVAIGSTSIHPEMKQANSMLRVMNYLGRLMNFQKMIPTVVCTLWTEFDIIKQNTIKNHDPVAVAHKITLCCYQLVLGFRANPSATFDELVSFSTTLLALATKINLDASFFEDNSALDIDQYADLLKDSDASDSDSDEEEQLGANSVDGAVAKKKKKVYSGVIARNDVNFKSNIVSYSAERNIGKKTTRAEIEATRENKLLKKNRVDLHTVGEFFDQVNITKLSLKSIDLHSYHSQSAILLLCTDIFRIACTDSVMRALYDSVNDENEKSIENVETSTQSTKKRASEESKRSQQILTLLNPLPQILLRAILNIRKRDAFELSQMGVIDSNNNTISGGTDDKKRQLFFQQQVRTGNVLISALRLSTVLLKLPLRSWSDNGAIRLRALSDFLITLLHKTPLPKFNPTAVADANRTLSKTGNKASVESVNTAIHMLGMKALSVLFTKYSSEVKLSPKKLTIFADLLHLDVSHDGCGADSLSVARILIERGRAFHHPTLVDIALKSGSHMVSSSHPTIRHRAMMLFYTYLNKFDLSTSQMDKHVSTLLAQFENPNIYTRRTVSEVLSRITHNFNIQILSKHAQLMFLTLCAALFNETDKTTRDFISQTITTLFLRLKTVSPKLIEPLLHMLFTWMSLSQKDLTSETFSSTNLRMALSVFPLILQPSIEFIAPSLPIIISAIAQITTGCYQRMMQESQSKIDQIKAAHLELREIKQQRRERSIAKKMAKAAEGEAVVQLGNKNLLPQTTADDKHDFATEHRVRQLKAQLEEEQVNFTSTLQQISQKKQIRNEDDNLSDEEFDELNDDDNESDVEDEQKQNKDGSEVDDPSFDEDDDDDEDNEKDQQDDEPKPNVLSIASETACTEWYMCFSALACFEQVWKILPLPMIDFLNRFDCNHFQLLDQTLVQINKETKGRPTLSFWSIVLQLTRHKHHWVRVASLNVINTHFEVINTLCAQIVAQEGSPTDSGPLQHLVPINNLHSSTLPLLALRSHPELFTKYTLFSSVQQIFHTAQSVCRLYNSIYIDAPFTKSLNSAIQFCIQLFIIFADSKLLSTGVLDQNNTDVLSSKGSISTVSNSLYNKKANNSNNPYSHSGLLWITTNLSFLYRLTMDVTIKQAILNFFLQFVSVTPKQFLSPYTNSVPIDTPKLVFTKDGKQMRQLADAATVVQSSEPHPILLSILSPCFRLMERQSQRTKDLRLIAHQIQSILSSKVGKTVCVDAIDHIRRAINNTRTTRKMKSNSFDKPRAKKQRLHKR